MWRSPVGVVMAPERGVLEREGEELEEGMVRLSLSNDSRENNDWGLDFKAYVEVPMASCW